MLKSMLKFAKKEAKHDSSDFHNFTYSPVLL